MNSLTAYKLIRRAGFAGLVLLAVILASMFLVPNSHFNLITLLVAFALTYGVFANNTLCAIGLLAYFTYIYTLNIIIVISNVGFKESHIGGIIFALFMSYIFVQGVRGSLACHKEKNTEDIKQRTSGS